MMYLDWVGMEIPNSPADFMREVVEINNILVRLRFLNQHKRRAKVSLSQYRCLPFAKLCWLRENVKVNLWIGMFRLCEMRMLRTAVKLEGKCIVRSLLASKKGAYL